MLKKLTGKNQKDYETVAKHIMDTADTGLFAQLVEQDGFLFDFVKQNVAKRLISATNEDNWQSVFKFLKFYSPSYEDVVVLPIVEHADDEITDKMLEIFEKGTDEEKAYCAKFFYYIQDPLAVDLLKLYAYSEYDYLSSNCALTLSAMNDMQSYHEALDKLNSEDEFEKFGAVKFLVNYGNKDALPKLIEIAKKTAMAENISAEIPYLSSLFEIFDTDFEGGLVILNNIVNGLGEIIPLSSIFDYELFDVVEYLQHRLEDSRVAVVLLNLIEKFDTLTENEEYLFDEDKNTKTEVFDIKKILAGLNRNMLSVIADSELNEKSLFVYTALELSKNLQLIRELLRCDNQTIILKTAEVLKKYNNLDETAKTVALLKITDENIKNIVRVL